MLYSVGLGYIDGKIIYEFKTSLGRTIYVAGWDIEDARFYGSRKALFWDEKIREDSGEVAQITVYIDID